MYISVTTNTITILQVKGEIYLVDEAMLSQLDILEDHPTYYRSPFLLLADNQTQQNISQKQKVQH